VEAKSHSAGWWAQFADASEKFDDALVTEGLSDEIIPKIESPLLRREAETAADVVVRHLNKPTSPELADRATKATARLVATVQRIAERSTAADDDDGLTELHALCHVLEGRWAEAAAAMEAVLGPQPLLRVFVNALRLERFDPALTLRLLASGQAPDMAVRSGLAIGKYGWWPSWLLQVVTERALAGVLDEAFIAALDQCAYADLSPAQARVARRLINGDQMLIDASAHRLEAMGEPKAAAKLREGDLNAVALAARLIPL
jgi:hypothetical protein